MGLVLIAMRWHYTDDVLLGVLIATLSFLLYDAYSEKWQNSWFYFDTLRTPNMQARKEETHLVRRNTTFRF